MGWFPLAVLRGLEGLEGQRGRQDDLVDHAGDDVLVGRVVDQIILPAALPFDSLQTLQEN